MSIRPPRQARPRRRATNQRDLAITFVASALIVLFGLRVVAALLGIAPWTAVWQVIAMPSDIIVSPVSRVPFLDSAVVSRLTVAEILAFAVVAGGALFALASLSLRRSR